MQEKMKIIFKENYFFSEKLFSCHFLGHLWNILYLCDRNFFAELIGHSKLIIINQKISSVIR